MSRALSALSRKNSALSMNSPRNASGSASKNTAPALPSPLNAPVTIRYADHKNHPVSAT